MKVEIELPKLNILGLSGSPRRNHNTDRLVKLALEEAKAFAPDFVETKFIGLSDYPTLEPYKPVRPGALLRKLRGEPIDPEDPTLEPIYDAWLWADGIIVGSPVYSAQPTGLLINCLQRVGAAVGYGFTYAEGFPHHKVAGVITTGNLPRGGQELALKTIVDFLMTWDIIVVASGIYYTQPSSSFIGGTVQTFFIRPDGYKHDPLGVRAVRGLARRVVEVTGWVKAGILAWEHIADELAEKRIAVTPQEEEKIEIDWDKYLNDPIVHEGRATTSDQIGFNTRTAIPKKFFEKMLEFMKLLGANPDEVREEIKLRKARLISDAQAYKLDPTFYGRWLKKK